MEQLWYYVTSPQAVIYAVATAMLYPVLVLEVVSLVGVVVDVGRLTAEAIVRKRSVGSIEDGVAKARTALAEGRASDVIPPLVSARRGRAWDRFFGGFSATHLGTPHVDKLIEDVEYGADRSLRWSRLLVRVGPMLGLMGTLIPISPALVALAQGDVQTLSDNLVIAFSSTVVGLLIGGLAYAITLSREHMYAQDMSDLEYVVAMLQGE